VGLAEVRAAQERYPEAIELYKKAIAVVPYPAYAANLADVYIKAGRTAEAKKQIDLIEFIGNLNPINRRVFYRELALFYADHDMKLKESMDLAYKEMDVRHDIYTWDILAWVLYKNGRDKEAADATSRALRLGTRDALLLFHAGMIYDRLGDIAKAKDYLRRALTSNPHFHVLYADTAQKKLEDLEVRNWGEGTKQWAENSRRN
jgi:tetratricopeptide (TPR) repeat protein